MPLPENIKDQIGDLRGSVNGIRWQKPEQMHLTLKFIGEIEEKMVERLKKDLTLVDADPFTMTFDGLGCFTRKGIPSVVWLGVEKSAELMSLKSEIERICSQAGIEKDDRDFKPHITLGRNREADKKGVYEYLEQSTEPDIDSFQAKYFTLYNSILSSEGAVHKPVKEFELS